MGESIYNEPQPTLYVFYFCPNKATWIDVADD